MSTIIGIIVIIILIGLVIEFPILIIFVILYCIGKMID